MLPNPLGRRLVPAKTLPSPPSLSRPGLAAAALVETPLAAKAATTRRMSAATVSPPQQPDLARPRRQHQEEPQRHEPEADADAAAKKPPNRMFLYFPLGYKEAAHQWWTFVSAGVAERNVLNLVPYLRDAAAAASSSAPDLVLRDDAAAAPAKPAADPFGHRVWRSSMVQLSGKNRALNEYSVERVGEASDETLVMLHGYGAGLGFFYKNFEPLSRAKGWRLYALDMLGMGNSSRPSFRVRAKDPDQRIDEAQDFFIDALEEWRRIRKIERFTLLGHSMGGYMAVEYALKYPGHINKLILVSPVGVPEDPYAVRADLPEPAQSTMNSEFTQDQESIVSHPDGASNAKPTAGDAALSSRTSTGSSSKQAAKTPATPRRPTPSWLVWLWDSNLVTPFSFVRAAGPLGPRVVSGWTTRRFNHLPPDESQALHTYAYSLFRQKGSGEYALPLILAPGAYARRPLIHRVENLGRGVVRPAGPDGSPEVRETGFPVVMMYGDVDWMDVSGGHAAEERIKRRAEKALREAPPEERERENGSAKVVVVSRAGHHLYLDNADEFNDYVLKELDETRRYDLKQKTAP